MKTSPNYIFPAQHKQNVILPESSSSYALVYLKSYLTDLAVEIVELLFVIVYILKNNFLL